MSANSGIDIGMCESYTVLTMTKETYDKQVEKVYHMAYKEGLSDALVLVEEKIKLFNSMEEEFKNYKVWANGIQKVADSLREFIQVHSDSAVK